jgi:hypothetical protein
MYLKRETNIELVTVDGTVLVWNGANQQLSNEMLVQEKEAMSRRAGVLNLMLHSTFNHELAMLMQQQQAALHAKKQNRFDYCLRQLFF